MVHQSSSRISLAARLGGPPPWVAGILNITPDSFSDGGCFNSPETALAQFSTMQRAGAQIIDIGGESTGPGSSPVSAEEEWQRIGDTVRAAVGQCFISIDTYKAATAGRCLALGAEMINDVSGLRADPDLAGVVAASNAYIVIMYSKEGSTPHVKRAAKDYDNIIDTVTSFFDAQIHAARSAGIKDDRIVLDPGMGGFISSKPEYSWQILADLRKLRQRFSEFAIMVGTSRKGFLSDCVDSSRPGSRDAASQLTALAAWQNGADIIRTHDPAMACEFVRIWQKLHPGMRA